MNAAPLGWRAHILMNLRLAAPLIIGQLATIGIWTSDVVAMGNLDTTSLAAGGKAGRVEVAHRHHIACPDADRGQLADNQRGRKAQIHQNMRTPSQGCSVHVSWSLV